MCSCGRVGQLTARRCIFVGWLLHLRALPLFFQSSTPPLHGLFFHTMQRTGDLVEDLVAVQLEECSHWANQDRYARGLLDWVEAHIDCEGSSCSCAAAVLLQHVAFSGYALPCMTCNLQALPSRAIAGYLPEARNPVGILVGKCD